MNGMWAIFPSGNSDAAQACADAWLLAGWNVSVMVDADQKPVECEKLLTTEKYLGIAWAWNQIMAALPDDVYAVAFINDDMFPKPCAANDVRSAFMEKFNGYDGVIQPTAIRVESMQWCSPSPIAGGWYLRRFRGRAAWHEGYFHYFCDQEFRNVAEKFNRYAEVEELGIEHRHHASGYADTLPPEKRGRMTAAWVESYRLYEKRKAEGFPI